MFSSLLIANRGEISRRIMRTARRLGIGTVAVYSDADAGAAFVREADEAVHIGPAPSAESYLRGDRIIGFCFTQAVYIGCNFFATLKAEFLLFSAFSNCFGGFTCLLVRI